MIMARGDVVNDKNIKFKTVNNFYPINKFK